MKDLVVADIVVAKEIALKHDLKSLDLTSRFAKSQ
jgi:hypothetical protein